MTISDSIGLLYVVVPLGFLLGLVWVILVQFGRLDL